MALQVTNYDFSGPRRGLMNPAEKRSSPGTLGPDSFLRGTGEGGTFMTQWIDGDELLRARWSNITGLLLRAIRARAVQPFDRITLDPVTDDKDPCLFCDHPGVGAENCSHAVAHLAPGQDIEAMAAGRVNLLPPICRRDCIPESLDQRVRGYAFLRVEVEAFEHAQGTGGAAVAVEKEDGLLGYAQRLLQKYPTKQEISLRIAEAEKDYPRLGASAYGALARGRLPSESSAVADERWYFRNRGIQT